jgi:hypothetical protein
MFITKSEKQSLVETSLNLGDKVLKLESELNFLKAFMKKSPSWKWVETLEKSLLALEKKHVEHVKYQALRTKNHISRIEFLEGRVRNLYFEVENMGCDIMELKLKRPVIVKEVTEPEKSTQKLVIAKKRGRPVGSKAKRPKFPPKTPFELLKPLGRPKGSKNKPK